jgi:hypothetical protein
MSTYPIWAAGHRLTLAWLALACAAVSYWEPTSLMHTNLIGGGLAGQVVMAVIVAMAIGALLDIALNDINESPLAPFLERHRADAYMLQSLMNLAFCFVLLKGGTWTWVAGIYFVLACGSLWVSVRTSVFIATTRRANA